MQVFDGTERDEALLGKADVVLLDVPCSGLGVMGKKRDIKYRVTAEGIQELEALQKQIVRACAGYVKPGGTLLYSTCTIQSGENEAMVRLITRELGFEPVSLAGILPEAVLAGKRKLEEALEKAEKEALEKAKEEALEKAQKEKKAPEKAEGAAGTKDKKAAAKEQEEISGKGTGKAEAPKQEK